MPSRRRFIQTLGASVAAAWLPAARAQGAPAVRTATLTPRVARQQIVPDRYPRTEIWGFDGRSPGPELRLRQGERVRIAVKNALPQETTVHWHGLRLPNAMDGVPHVTQPPIRPGGEFVYEFDLPDAGTFWYHPHEQSLEQVGRGLYGAFIVEEREPIRVDRDVTWVLSDWRLASDASQREDWSSMFDMSHNGRVGNTVTVNGRFTPADGVFEVTRGERLRLRLVNTATARIFALRFAGHAPQVIAYDGQPVAPHAPVGGRVVLGPGMRADLVIDCMGEPGARFEVGDDYYPRARDRLIWISYRAGASLRDAPLGTPIALPPNPLPEPDVARAERHRIVFEGGAMSPRMMGGGMMGGMAGGGHPMLWFINGKAVPDDHHAIDPLLKLARGGHYVFEMTNDTMWDHPIHLHGFPFRVLAVNGAAAPLREWRDTVLMAPRSRVDIAFVAEEAGDWMFHCHVLSHQHAGMMTTVRVS